MGNESKNIFRDLRITEFPILHRSIKYSDPCSELFSIHTGLVSYHYKSRYKHSLLSGFILLCLTLIFNNDSVYVNKNAKGITYSSSSSHEETICNSPESMSIAMLSPIRIIICPSESIAILSDVVKQRSPSSISINLLHINQTSL